MTVAVHVDLTTYGLISQISKFSNGSRNRLFTELDFQSISTIFFNHRSFVYANLLIHSVLALTVHAPLIKTVTI